VIRQHQLTRIHRRHSIQSTLVTWSNSRLTNSMTTHTSRHYRSLRKTSQHHYGLPPWFIKLSWDESPKSAGWFSNLTLAQAFRKVTAIQVGSQMCQQLCRHWKKPGTSATAARWWGKTLLQNIAKHYIQERRKYLIEFLKKLAHCTWGFVGLWSIIRGSSGWQAGTLIAQSLW